MRVVPSSSSSDAASTTIDSAHDDNDKVFQVFSSEYGSPTPHISRLSAQQVVASLACT
jgi:hypothetical protein